MSCGEMAYDLFNGKGICKARRYACVQPCSYQHYSQEPNGGSDPSTHLWINGK